MPKDKISQLQAKRDALVADLEKREAEKREAAKEKKRIEAELRREMKKTERRKENQRKFLAGAAILDEAKTRPEVRRDLYALLDRFLTREYDRSFFPDLPPRSQAPVTVQQENELALVAGEHEPA